MLALTLSVTTVAVAADRDEQTAPTTTAAGPPLTTSPPPTLGPAVTAPATTAPGAPTTVPGVATTAPTQTVPPTAASTVPPTTAAQPLTFEPFSGPRGIPRDIGWGPQFLAAEILAPTDAHPWVMTGDYRSNPGAVEQVVVYTSPVNQPGLWSLVAFTGEESPTSVRAAIDLPDGTVLLLGSADSDAGPVPTTWVFDGTTLSAPTTIGDATSLGRVLLADLNANGTVFALIERPFAGERTQVEVAVRNSAGNWALRPFELQLSGVEFGGIAANGNHVVVTGSGTSVNSARLGYQTAAWVSTDGAKTFSLADTRPLHSTAVDTQFGDVLVGADGYYAAVCLDNGGAIRSGLARSTDGTSWAEVPITAASELWPVSEGGCADIDVDAEGGVWIGGATTFYSLFFRVLNGTVDRIAAAEVTGTQGPVTSGNRQLLRFAVSDSHLAIAVPQYGGPMAGFAPVAELADFDNLFIFDSAEIEPTSHEIIVDVQVLNDLGSVIGIVTYPFIEEVASGGYNYLRRITPFTIGPDGVGVKAPGASPIDPRTNSGVAHIVTIEGGEVALTQIAEDVPADYEGPIGDLAISTRPTGGQWSPLEVIVGGPGRQEVVEAVVVGGAVVAAGNDVGRDQSTGRQSSTAYVLVQGADGFSRIDLGVSADAETLSVCALGPTQALVLGVDWAGGRGFSAIVDVPTATHEIVDQQIEPAGAVPTRCVAAQGGALVEVSTGAGIALFQTRDGRSYGPLDVLSAGDSVHRTRGSAHGVAIVGVTGAAEEDAFVLFGPNLQSLQRIELDTFVGAGEQQIYDIVITEDRLFAVGLINQSPVVWPINYS